MNKGVIEQVGTAENLYRQPASVFVARFIGRTNLIDAAVTAVSAGRMDATIAGQLHAIRGSAVNVKTGEMALAIMRPERIGIGPPNGGLEGKVVARTYFGEKIEYDIEVAGQRLQIVRFNPPPSELRARRYGQRPASARGRAIAVEGRRMMSLYRTLGMLTLVATLLLSPTMTFAQGTVVARPILPFRAPH